MIDELDTVALNIDLPEYGLKKGDLGAVVHAYPGHPEYEVEFVDLGGSTVALVTLTAGQIRPVGLGEIAHARPVLVESEA